MQGCVHKNVSRKYQGPKHNRDVAFCSSLMPLGTRGGPATWSSWLWECRSAPWACPGVCWSPLLSACGFWMLSSGSFPFAASPASSRMSLGPVSACPVRATSPSRSFCSFPSLPGVSSCLCLFLLPLSHSEPCDTFQLQGPPLDLLVGLHGLLGSSVIQFFKTSLNLFHFLLWGDNVKFPSLPYSTLIFFKLAIFYFIESRVYLGSLKFY